MVQEPQQHLLDSGAAVTLLNVNFFLSANSCRSRKVNPSFSYSILVFLMKMRKEGNGDIDTLGV